MTLFEAMLPFFRFFSFFYFVGQLQSYLEYVNTLEYNTEPNYENIRTFFKSALKKAGHTDDGASIVLPSTVSIL